MNLDERQLLGLMAAVLAAGVEAAGQVQSAAGAVDTAQALLSEIDAREAARREPPPAP